MCIRDSSIAELANGKKIAYSITNSAYLIPREPKHLCLGIFAFKNKYFLLRSEVCDCFRSILDVLFSINIISTLNCMLDFQTQIQIQRLRHLMVEPVLRMSVISVTQERHRMVEITPIKPCDSSVIGMGIGMVWFNVPLDRLQVILGTSMFGVH